ncbi:hypothetical protein CALCODRAFT_254791 [Calocera cornea HHB12733]|uniref:Uncharacterized protein n=1 Tax=Calocera cornea HHB12733 TaxID=1353952 RepID=A0A165GN38_9BASI|nr:hypothetical protein CALCODRAFT_254791 [Calocera cornea HHB12733]
MVGPDARVGHVRQDPKLCVSGIEKRRFLFRYGDGGSGKGRADNRRGPASRFVCVPGSPDPPSARPEARSEPDCTRQLFHLYPPGHACRFITSSTTAKQACKERRRNRHHGPGRVVRRCWRTAHFQRTGTTTLSLQNEGETLPTKDAVRYLRADPAPLSLIKIDLRRVIFHHPIVL